jgi:hypothetical protein
LTSLPGTDHAGAFDEQHLARGPVGTVNRAALVREAGPRSRIRTHHVRRVLARMGIDSVNLLHLSEPGVPDALALAGGLAAVGPLDLIVALTPQVEVDAARVAVQSDAALARLRHAHPAATLRRLLGTGQVVCYSTLGIEMAGEERLAVDHVLMQNDRAGIGARIDDQPLPDGHVVQVVAANPLAGLPRSPSLDPRAIGSVTVLSNEGDPGHGYGLGPHQQLSCASHDGAEVRIDARRLASPQRELTIHAGSRRLRLVVVDETGRR